MKKINIITPVYNESEVISDFHSELSKVVGSLKHRYFFEIIYILDKSTDNTLEILKNICSGSKNVKLVVLARRFGHQMSLVAGMDKCTGDAVIMLDSDLEHPPRAIPQLLEKFEQGYDVVHTRRVYSKEVPFLKRLTSKLFYQMLGRISYISINKDAADFRLISKRVLSIFQNNIREQNQFLRGLFSWVGFKQTEIDFISEGRKKGKSKYNLQRLFNFAIVGTISFSRTPLRVSVIAGIGLSLLSMVYGVYSLIAYIFNSKIPQGWTSLVMMLAFIGGVQLIVLGIIGEYIGSIFEEVKNRPLYIIEEECDGKLENKE